MSENALDGFRIGLGLFVKTSMVNLYSKMCVEAEKIHGFAETR